MASLYLFKPIIALLLCACWSFCFASQMSGFAKAHSSVNTPTKEHSVANSTIAGTDRGCKHRSQYFINPNVHFEMCTGQTNQDLKNGMSIINLINLRGFLPTCRVMQLMLWMASTASDKSIVGRDLFVDVGANIGTSSLLYPHSLGRIDIV